MFKNLQLLPIKVLLPSIYLVALFACTSKKAPVSPKQSHLTTSGYKMPSKVVFFNDTLHLQDQDLKERLDREILVNMYFQSSTHLIIKRCTRYFPLIENILKQEGVPDDFKYLCVIESNLSNVTSPAGASGFWQFMPFTAPEYGLRITPEIDERLHVEKSTRAACALIKSNYSLFKDWVNACAAYNRGPGGLMDDLKFQHVKHFFDAEMNQETGRYVFRIMAMKMILENPNEFGFEVPQIEKYPIYITKKITITEPIENLAQWSINQGYNRRIIRLLNPWILGNKLTNKSLPCTIEIPNSNNQLKVFNP